MAYWNPSPLGSRSMTEGSAAAAVRVPKRRARLDVFQAARQDLGGGGGAAIHQHGQRSAKGFGAGEDHELEREAAQVLGAQLETGLVGEPSGDTHGEAADAAGLPRRSMTKPRQSRHPLMASSMVLASPSGSRKILNRTEADVLRQAAPLAPDGRRRQVAQADDLAAGGGAVEVDGDLAVGAIQEFDGDGGTGSAFEASQDGAAQAEVEQGRVLELLLDSRYHGSDLGIADAQDLPAGFDAFGGRGRAFIDGGNDGAAVEDAQVDPGVGFAAIRGGIEVVVDGGGKDAEVGLLQASHHVVEDFANGVGGLGGFDFGAQFVVHGLPVEAAEFGVPVFVADRGPDLLEGFDAGGAVGGLAGGGGCGGDCQHEYPGTVQHASTIA